MPFSNVLSQKHITQALTAAEVSWKDRRQTTDEARGKSGLCALPGSWNSIIASSPSREILT